MCRLLVSLIHEIVNKRRSGRNIFIISIHSYTITTSSRIFRNQNDYLLVFFFFGCSIFSPCDFGYLLNTEYEVPRTKTGKISRQNSVENPNELSEELLKCLIGIFLELNQASLDIKESETSVSRLTLSCMQSKSFISMTNSSNYKTHSYLSNGNASCLDPYGISADLDCKARDVGPYKNFIQISSSSLETEFFSQCLPAFRKLRFISSF